MRWSAVWFICVSRLIVTAAFDKENYRYADKFSWYCERLRPKLADNEKGEARNTEPEYAPGLGSLDDTCGGAADY